MKKTGKAQKAFPSPSPAPGRDFLEQAAHYLPIGLAVVGRDEKMEYLNPKFTAMFGYDAQDVPELKAWFEKAYPDQKTSSRMMLAWTKEMLKTPGPGGTHEGASTVRRKDGSEISVHCRVTAIGGGRRVLTFEDITERVRAEVLMLDGWNIYRNLVETVLDWTWEIRRDGVFTYSSPQVKNILGYPAGEIVGRKFTDFMSDQDARRLRPLLRDWVRIKKPSISFEITCPTRDGRIVSLEMTGTALFDKAGKLIGFRGINRDITERKALESALHASHEKMRALTAKLEDVREEERTHISRELHDELGQVLTGLKIDLTWLEKRIPADQKPLVEKALAMKGQIDSIIEYIRRIATQLRPKLLDDFGFIEAIEWLISDFRERTAIRCRLRSNLSHISIDPKASTIIFRIIQETLTNIMRHSGASSVTIDIKAGSGNLFLAVKDNGIGINEDEIAAGRSLGILGIRERVAILNGTMKIEGAPGKGTTVKISIPLTRTEA